jgi:VanZ family protein
MSPRALASLWVPPLALMGLIFFLSAQPELRTNLGVLDLVGRKVLHATEYAVLCALWWRALRTVTGERTALASAAAIAVAYAVTDEFHQTFIPGRNGSPVDVGIDAAGTLLAAFLIRRSHGRPRSGAPGGTEPEAARASRAG